jgi:hypothetical protein
MNIAPHFVSKTRGINFRTRAATLFNYAIALASAWLDRISRAACTAVSVAPSGNDFNISKNPPAVTVYKQLPTVTLTSKCAALPSRSSEYNPIPRACTRDNSILISRNILFFRTCPKILYAEGEQKKPERLGVPAFGRSPFDRHSWGTTDLGLLELPDAEAAQITGRTVVEIAAKRKELGRWDCGTITYTRRVGYTHKGPA